MWRPTNEIGENRGGEDGVFGVVPQRPLGLPGSAASIAERRDIARPSGSTGVADPAPSRAERRSPPYSAGPSVNTLFNPAARATNSPPRSRKVLASTMAALASESSI